MSIRRRVVLVLIVYCAMVQLALLLQLPLLWGVRAVRVAFMVDAVLLALSMIAAAPLPPALKAAQPVNLLLFGLAMSHAVINPIAFLIALPLWKAPNVREGLEERRSPIDRSHETNQPGALGELSHEFPVWGPVLALQFKRMPFDSCTATYWPRYTRSGMSVEEIEIGRTRARTVLLGVFIFVVIAAALWFVVGRRGPSKIPHVGPSSGNSAS